ncbi:MAG: hypothetical protein SGI77_15645 [Pirellulaceae bacterium]|nr:hypothetical protein [Pirellulaceae bacterium]
MNAQQAIDDIREIGEILARARHTSCIRATPIAGTALVAIIAASLAGFALEPMFPGEASFVRYWFVVACLNALIVAVDLGVRYWNTDSELQRGTTRIAIYQFAPCLFIGGFATLCLLPTGEQPSSLLPGLWCIIISLGLFATLNNAPPAMIFPAAFYAIVGGLFWRFDEWTVGLGSWSMGLAFGIGQLWTAAVLWRGPNND